VEDTKELLNNYHELLGIIERIRVSKVGKVNNSLNKLIFKTKEFLNEYDDDENGTIDVLELIDKREEFGEDLSKEKPGKGGSQLGDIIILVKQLENTIVNYRQGILKKKKDDKKLKNILAEETKDGKEIVEGNHQVIDLDE
jgi:hypothetical protein